MRLNAQEQNSIMQIARRHFGENVRVILFGSRIDDTKKGGDIDLLIIPEKSEVGEVKRTFKQKRTMGVVLEVVFSIAGIDIYVYFVNDNRAILKTAG